jgi:DNA-binding Lrp family transcriptional regulator
MVAAYVLLNTRSGLLKEAVKTIIEIDGVRSIDAVTGPYDAIVSAEAGTNDELGSLVVSEIQKAPGVEKTLTCLVVDLEQKAKAA